MPHAQSSGLDIGLTCGGRQSNLCLQQMVTVVTAVQGSARANRAHC